VRAELTRGPSPWPGGCTRRSRHTISAELERAAHVNERGNPFHHKSVRNARWSRQRNIAFPRRGSAPLGGDWRWLVAPKVSLVPKLVLALLSKEEQLWPTCTRTRAVPLQCADPRQGAPIDPSRGRLSQPAELPATPLASWEAAAVSFRRWARPAESADWDRIPHPRTVAAYCPRCATLLWRSPSNVPALPLSHILQSPCALKALACSPHGPIDGNRSLREHHLNAHSGGRQLARIVSSHWPASGRLAHLPRVIGPSRKLFERGALSEMTDRLAASSTANVHAVLVPRGGKLVFERYFRGSDEIHTRRVGKNVTSDVDTLHDMKSVSKSVASLALGIAIDRGLIRSVNAATLCCGNLCGQTPWRSIELGIATPRSTGGWVSERKPASAQRCGAR